MPSNKLHNAEPQPAKNYNNATSEDATDGRRLTSKPQPHPKTPAGDPHDQPTPEEFGRRGMGMAAKE